MWCLFNVFRGCNSLGCKRNLLAGPDTTRFASTGSANGRWLSQQTLLPDYYYNETCLNGLK
jgi:hypothetical protein